MPIMGTETEYGITAPGRPDLDAHDLSALVVEACGAPATPALDHSRNRWLANGARLYVDHGHPEYSGPECRTPTDALAWELAGDQIVAGAAAAASERVGAKVAVFRNNTDGKGRSYGYHENHLLSRRTPWERVVAHLPSFLVSRIVFTGAGRVGLGQRSEDAGFQLSQRADFFERLSGLDTTANRGIINTRDEALADREAFRRLHVITGDATRSPYATWLKVGTLGLVLAALEADLLPAVALDDPVAAFHRISRDLTLAEGRAIQARFRDACALAAERIEFPEASEIVEEWTAALDGHRQDRLDWSVKLSLLQRYRDRDGLGWDHPKLAQVDLAWAELGEDSIVARLQRAGCLPAGPDAAVVDRATRTPPAGTRAHVRGSWVRDRAEQVVAANWDSLLVRDHEGLRTLRLPDPHASGAMHAD